MVVRPIVIGRVDVWWILYFTMHTYITHWLRDALPMDAFLVVTSHMRDLKYDIRGEAMTMSVRNVPDPVTGRGQDEGTRLRRWDWLVVTERDDQPL